MILNVSHLSKSFPGSTVIRDASFLLNEHEKAAVVGLNGAGKTTLLNMITGELSPDSGTVSFRKDLTVGYLKQINDVDSELTIREELTRVIQPILDLADEMLAVQERMKHAGGDELEQLYREYDSLLHAYESRDGYAAESRVNGILNGLGFTPEETEKPLKTLSGGQKTRVFLGKLLLEHPDLILLDEPTNHLDLSSIEWLETYLSNYSGAVIVVSHDRYFLDRIVSKVIDVESGRVTVYPGNYTEYADRKAAERESAMRAYLNQQQEIRHQEEVIRRLKSFNREKSIKRAESREKLLDRVERLEKPAEEMTGMDLFFSQSEQSGNDVLKAEDLSKSFGDNRLFSGLSFELKRGEHAAIIGDNGTGKTTLLKLITGDLVPDEGTVTFGTRVWSAYYDQEHQVLHHEKTLFEEIQDSWPDMNNTAVRSVLAAFLFTGDDVFKRVGDLSGGERGRVSLAKLMLSKANFLILDEPTNHLDIVSKEILERALRKFPGTVLYVSHDRYFINRTATRILDLTGGKLLNYIGNYDYYLEKKADVELAAGLQPSSGSRAGLSGAPRGSMAAAGIGRASSGSPSPASGAADASSGAADYAAAKARKAEARKRKNALEKCEAEIHRLEETVKRVDEAFLDPEKQRDAAGLIALQKEKDEAEAALEELYTEWEALASEEEE